MSGSKKWLGRFRIVMDENLDNPLCNNERLAEALEISERQLFRKVKALTGISPKKYFTQYQL